MVQCLRGNSSELHRFRLCASKCYSQGNSVCRPARAAAWPSRARVYSPPLPSLLLVYLPFFSRFRIESFLLSTDFTKRYTTMFAGIIPVLVISCFLFVHADLQELSPRMFAGISPIISRFFRRMSARLFVAGDARKCLNERVFRLPCRVLMPTNTFSLRGEHSVIRA